MIKKYVFFIVEGLHDKEEIGAILDTPYFKDFKASFVPQYLIPDLSKKGGKLKCSNGREGGDITSDCSSTESNIVGRITELVINAMNEGLGLGKVRHSDVARIVHVSDADGAFIPREAVIRASEKDNDKYIYYADRIETTNVDGLVGRNKKKSKILDKLSKVKQINNIPYSIYYVARDMDHVLFNNRNMNRKNKRESAYWFIRECKDNPSVIMNTVLNPKIATNLKYEDSWEHIQHGVNSLYRSTNLNLFLMEISKELLQQVK